MLWTLVAFMFVTCFVCERLDFSRHQWRNYGVLDKKKQHIIYKNIQYITANIECWAFASPVTRIKCWHFPFLHVSYLSKYQHIMHRIMFGLHVHELTFLSGGRNNGIGGGVTYSQDSCQARDYCSRQTFASFFTWQNLKFQHIHGLQKCTMSTFLLVIRSGFASHVASLCDRWM